MKIQKIASASFDFEEAVGIAITLENGNRHAVSIHLPLDTEEIPEAFQKMGKLLRDWARKQSEAEKLC